MRQLLLRLFLILLISSQTAISYAVQIIRDAEAEEVIDLIIAPLIKTSKIGQLNIHLVNDQVPNAFTDGYKTVYLNVGLIAQHPDPDILRGVIAHEMGHILGKHASRQGQIIENYHKAALVATAIGIATALSSDADAGLGLMIGGQDYAQRSLYAYSREFEASADQTAVQLLEKSGHSAVGLMNFFNHLNNVVNKDLINNYEQTHPLSHQRLNQLRQYVTNSKFPHSRNSQKLVERYQRLAAKLAAFTLPIEQIDNYHIAASADRAKEIEHYMQAIKKFRQSKFDDAVNEINRLIVKYPDDAFYHELKAQIYFEAGKKGAVNEYLLAETYRPQNVLIKLGYAIAGINQDPANVRMLNRYYRNLKFVLNQEPDNLLALHYASIYFDRKGLKGEGYLNAAIIAVKTENIAQARRMAKAALKILPNRSTQWYQASDILAQIGE